MKKFWIFAALVVTVKLAVAQSSVTIYGLIDQGVTWANDGTAPGFSLPGRGTANAIALQQGNGSRLGFLGKETLGDSWYTAFQLESRFYPNNGMMRGQLFYGRSWMGVGDSGYGELRLGRQYQPAYIVALRGDPTEWSYVSQLGSTYTYARYDQSTPADSSSVRWNNMISYRTPNYNGLGMELSSALGDPARGNNGQRKPSKGGNIQYDSGPFYAGIGFDGLDIDHRLYLAVLSYNFGVVRPIITYANAKGGANGDGKSFAASLAFSIDVDRAWLSVGRYLPGGRPTNSSMVGTGYEHLLSKRSLLYFDGGFARVGGGARTLAFDTGIKHLF
ncbi:UNVERIFIED_ORG: putative porin [Burkholderia sp. CF145]